MALFDNGFKVGTGLLVGVGAILLAPIVIPAIAAAAKPLIKAGIKGGMLAYEKGRELLAEATEVMEDLAAEAKAELVHEHEVAAASATHVEEGSAG